MPSVVYLVTTPKSQMVKVGVWTGDTQALYFRYIAVYGKETLIHTFHTENPRQLEKEFKDQFEPYSKMIRGELFDRQHFIDYLHFIVNKTNSTPVVIDNKIHFENNTTMAEKIDEYRMKHDITPEQVEINKEITKNRMNKVDKFLIVTSPDVDVVVFKTSSKQGYQIADFYSTYFGQNTKVYYVHTNTTNTHPGKFKHQMALAFQMDNNVWSIYEKQHIGAYLSFIYNTNAYKVFYDRKQTLWTPNPQYDPSKKKPKTVKVEVDTKRLNLPKEIDEDEFKTCQTSTYSSGSPFQIHIL